MTSQTNESNWDLTIIQTDHSLHHLMTDTVITSCSFSGLQFHISREINSQKLNMIRSICRSSPDDNNLHLCGVTRMAYCWPLHRQTDISFILGIMFPQRVLPFWFSSFLILLFLKSHPVIMCFCVKMYTCCLLQVSSCVFPGLVSVKVPTVDTEPGLAASLAWSRKPSNDVPERMTE